MTRRQQWQRLIEIDRQVRAGRYPTARSLAEQLEVSERTIYGDREYLLDVLGAPLAFDAERGGWGYTDRTWMLPSVLVTEGELLAFFLSVDVAERYLGTAFEAPLKSAVSKLAQSLDSPAIVSLETLREHYTFASPGAPPVEPALRVDLEQAIVQRHRVRVRYFTASRGAVTERTLDPYHLHNRHGEWYLVAHDHLRHAKRLFHLSRVQSWRVLAGRFERTPDFDPVAWLQSAFALEMGDRTYQVEVRFDGYQARWIRERHWHPSQQPLEELADGGVVLRFQAQGLGAVQRWVQQFGAHAEVLAPDALRKAISAEIAALARLYEARR